MYVSKSPICSRLCIPAPIAYNYTTSSILQTSGRLSRIQSLLLNMIGFLGEPILVRAIILLPVSQHIRRPSLNHTLTAHSQLSSAITNPKGRKTTHSPSDMSLQPFLPLFMHGMPLPNLTQTIPQQELIVTRREERSRHIDQDCDPAVIHISECLPAKEDGCHNSRSKITGEVCRDGDVCEAPDHGGVCKTDGERGAGGRDKGVGGVQAGPDDEANVGVDEKFGQEEVAKVSECGCV